MNEKRKLSVGLDIGSTTAKIVVREGEKVIFGCYERHFSKVREKALELVRKAEEHINGAVFTVAVSGSAGLGLARAAGLNFVQEVYATSEAVQRFDPKTDVVIELGGEDAKVIFFRGGVDERMNGSCAGGTGAFIDQMATLMDITPTELDELSLKAERIYPIASRCGVFAKTDIQPLLNQGARKEDIAASIYRAVVNQTIAGLAQGRAIKGRVMFLGGPLYFCKGLRRQFIEVLGLSDENAVFPEDGRLSVAIGAALVSERTGDTMELAELIARLEQAEGETAVSCIPPLFADEEEYAEFKARHMGAAVKEADIQTYTGDAYLGIDSGSTTTKLVLLTRDKELLYSYYASNKGNPVEVIRGELQKIYELAEDRITIRGAATTGYGEDLIKAAFRADAGLVETMAHYRAARFFEPEVDFILDIGGQDIKCFKIKDHSVDSIMLNEACSSGCGSFIETFASAMGYTAEEFSKKGLFAKAPVELGTRCTVFMNSSVKQAQKDGATVEDISAGLSVSVVKNAIYKVIRAHSAEELGEKIVVQGGTFYNDAVLRSFERELGRNVIRPRIAGLMGAFGAALYARSLKLPGSALLTKEELALFTHKAKAATCHGCENNCRITVNTFASGAKYISGNRCERGAGKAVDTGTPNLYSYKLNKLLALPEGEGKRTIGLPLTLGMYELAPLWHGIFRKLGFKVRLSGASSRELYSLGQYSIPSDTACYPAKLMHGHIEKLISEDVDAVFYPALTHNINEGAGDNHYNCPVVAYYSEVLQANVDDLKKTRFMYPYLNINSEKELARGLGSAIKEAFGQEYPMGALRSAVKEGFAAYKAYMQDIREKGRRAIEWARERGNRIMVLAGRPYHIDPEVSHGIDRLAASLGFAVVSEDSVAELVPPVKVNVLNQWTYHTRLYRAAEYAARNEDVELVQLVSFGCGVDAITGDEVRSILESRGKLYTQLKIDEITNLGAVKIRLRSLIGALEERRCGDEA